MRKRVVGMITLILILMAVCTYFFVYNPLCTEQALIDTVNKSAQSQIKIMHIEKVGGKAIVFYIVNNSDKKNAGLVTSDYKKTIFGWKYVYGGVEGIGDIPRRVGLTYIFFPNVKGTPYPMFSGIISNPDIKKIKVVEKKRGTEIPARIINDGNINLWFADIEKLQGSKFEIQGFSNNGKKIAGDTYDISPYYAEQKPISQ